MPFQTGAVGWFGYDLAHHLERLPHPAVDDLAFPDLAVGFYDTVLAFDGQERRAWLMTSGWPEGTPEASMHRRKARADQFADLLGRVPEPVPVPAVGGEVGLRSNFTRSAYERAVGQVVDYILAGDIFQANIAQRFSAPFHGCVRDLTCAAMRSAQPWYGAHVEWPKARLLHRFGTSPIRISA